MTVLLIDSASELGGAQRSLVELAVALQARGLTVQAAVPAGTLASTLQTAGVPVRLIPAVRLHRRLHWRALQEIAHFIAARMALARAIQAVRPDILHANGLTSALLAVTAAPPCPVLWHVRDLTMPRVAVRYLARRVDSIIAISKPVSELLHKIVPPHCAHKIQQIGNGIDTAHFHPGDRALARQTFRLPAETPLVGVIAHLVPWKQHRGFLDVAAAIHHTRADVRFVIVGRDLFHDHPSARSHLEKQIAATGLTESVIWMPDLDDVASLLPAFDVLVHPAADEPFGRVLCEAMATGIPVVAVNRAGPAGIVPDGVGGYLVAPDNVEAFARQTLHLLNHPETAGQMSAAARQHVLTHFDITRTAAEIHELYTRQL